MSRHRRQKRNDTQPASPADRKSPSIAVVIALVAGSVAVVFGWRSAAYSDARPTAALAQADVSRPAATTENKPAFLKLKGKWLRPDGGYVLDIGAADETGKLEASYLNPRPIHIARAEASQDGEVVKVFVELRDVNYPGSTYDLAYDPQSDQLKGIYYQAVLKQRLEVFFVRMQ